MPAVGKMRIEKDADDKPLTEYGVRKAGGIRLLVTLQYLQDDSDTDGSVIQLSLTPIQALDFGVRLIDHGRALMLPHAAASVYNC